MELWAIAAVMGLDEETERLQGPPVAVVPRAEETGALQSGPRLRSVQM